MGKNRGNSCLFLPSFPTSQLQQPCLRSQCEDPGWPEPKLPGFFLGTPSAGGHLSHPPLIVGHTPETIKWSVRKTLRLAIHLI